MALPLVGQLPHSHFPRHMGKMERGEKRNKLGSPALVRQWWNERPGGAPDHTGGDDWLGLCLLMLGETAIRGPTELPRNGAVGM